MVDPELALLKGSLEINKKRKKLTQAKQPLGYVAYSARAK